MIFSWRLRFGGAVAIELGEGRARGGPLARPHPCLTLSFRGEEEADLSPLLHSHPTMPPPHPRGAAIRKASRWWGWARRLRPALQAGLGRLRGTALGVLRPLCEELAGTVVGITPSSHAGRRDNPMRGTGARGLAAKAGLRPDKRGPETKNADKRSATGRADGGSIHPRRILAQRMRISDYAPRGAPLPLVCYACVRARAGIWCVRHSRAKPSGPAFGRPKDRLRADPRISGR